MILQTLKIVFRLTLVMGKLVARKLTLTVTGTKPYYT